MRETIVAGNWKMHGNAATAAELAGAVARAEGIEARVVLCPPHPYLAAVARSVADSAVEVGAQDVHSEASGAFTGDISAEMARDCDARWSIVGHSERRAGHGESDSLVGAKVLACERAGLRAIVCVGEPLDVRREGGAESWVAAQLEGLLSVIGALRLPQLVLAYEPIWAIGTGETATPEIAQAMHEHVRGWLRKQGAPDVPVLYGGSVNEANAAGLLAMPDIDGALVGGASLDAERFARICRSARS